MITELALLRVRAKLGPAFEAAFAQVRHFLSSADGHIDHRLVRSVDDPNLYLLEVWWQDLEAHVRDFEPSEGHGRLMLALTPLLVGEPFVLHVPPWDRRDQLF